MMSCAEALAGSARATTSEPMANVMRTPRCSASGALAEAAWPDVRQTAPALMGWLGYTLITVACWAGWSFLGKLALDHTTSVQAALVFGVVSALVAVVA